MQHELPFVECYGISTRVIPGAVVCNFQYDQPFAPGQDASEATTLCVYFDANSPAEGQWHAVAKFANAYSTLTHLEMVGCSKSSTPLPFVLQHITHVTNKGQLGEHIWTMFPCLETLISVGPPGILFDIRSLSPPPRTLRHVQMRNLSTSYCLTFLQSLPAEMETIDISTSTDDDVSSYLFPATFPHLRHANLFIKWSRTSMADLTMEHGPLNLTRATGVVPTGCFTKGNCSATMAPHCTSWGLYFNYSNSDFESDFASACDWVKRQESMTELEITPMYDHSAVQLFTAIAEGAAKLTRAYLPLTCFDSPTPPQDVIDAWTRMIESQPLLTCIGLPRGVSTATILRALAGLPDVNTLIVDTNTDTTALLAIVQAIPGIMRLECHSMPPRGSVTLSWRTSLCEALQLCIQRRPTASSFGIGIK